LASGVQSFQSIVNQLIILLLFQSLVGHDDVPPLLLAHGEIGVLKEGGENPSYSVYAKLGDDTSISESTYTEQVDDAQVSLPFI